MQKIYKKHHFWMFILPLLLFYTVFEIVPLFVDLVFSFTDYRAVGTAQWNGIANYAKLFGDENLKISVVNTVKITVLMLVILVPLSFFLAYNLNRQSRKNNVCKVILFAPYVIPMALTALIWSFILNPSSGLINAFLSKVGLGGYTQDWINGRVLSPYSFAVVNAWASMGFYISLWQVGLRSIPTDILEASLIDGCTNKQQIRYMILPMLKETLGSILIFALTAGLKTYEIVYILTDGGPIHYSESIVSYMYSVIFTNMQYGYGMAIAVFECVLALVATLIILKLTKRLQD